jgi:hypothetical protein
MVKMLSRPPAAVGPRRQLAIGASLSAAASAVLLLTAAADGSRLGAPSYWAWLLTALQVLALWAAGRRRSWGWLLGAGVQPVWITYALLTGQVGFIPGCAVSAAVQARSFLRSAALTLEGDSR